MANNQPYVDPQRDPNLYEGNGWTIRLEEVCNRVYIHFDGAVDICSMNCLLRCLSDAETYLNTQKGAIIKELRSLSGITQELADQLETSKRIVILINSPGGRLDAISKVVDRIRSFDIPVQTHAVSQAASCGSILLAAGHIRTASSHARILLHEPRWIQFSYEGAVTRETLAELTRKLDEAYNSMKAMYAGSVNLEGEDFDQWHQDITKDEFDSSHDHLLEIGFLHGIGSPYGNEMNFSFSDSEEEVDEHGEVDYSEYTNTELKELLKERGVSIPPRSKKADLIELLENSDEE